MDGQRSTGYTPPIVDADDAPPHLILLGHLAITVPVIAAIPLVVFWGLYQLGPSLWPYYVTGGLALAWQWYLIALPRWQVLLTRSGLQDNQTEAIARRSGLVWPGTATIGSLALHTTAAAVCGLHIGPWLLSRWLVWILPPVGVSSGTPRGDYWLQYLELVSILPALVVGYVVFRYFEKLAAWAWAVPTIILAYRFFTFTDAHASVLAPTDPWSRFSYYFVIQQHMPTLLNFRISGSDPVRVAEQMTVTVPFYSGIAYSVGALLRKYKVIDRIVCDLRREPEPEVFGPAEAEVEWNADGKEDPTHRSK